MISNHILLKISLESLRKGTKTDITSIINNLKSYDKLFMITTYVMNKTRKSTQNFLKIILYFCFDLNIA